MGLPVGTVLARRYCVRSQLGEGGMGCVYQVDDLTRPGASWAVKELLDDGTASPEDVAWAKRRFADEIALMRTLSHPRIPAFHDSFTDYGRQYLVMELIGGTNLEERLERAHAPLPERDVLRWMLAVCDVLTYLHSQHPPIIVRDLKPGNIMVTPTGDVRLIDFGIARRYKIGKIGNTENLGTMTYASPEHVGQAQTDARSDIYSLGATIFHLLTNTEPKPLETPAPGTLQRFRPPISEATDRAVVRAMHLDPRLRFQSAAAFREALAKSLAALTAGPANTGNGVVKPVVLPRGAAATLPVPVPRRPAAKPNPAPATRATLSQHGDICPSCGYLNRQGAKFCVRDGTQLASMLPSSARAVQHAHIAPTAGATPIPRSRTATAASAELSLRRATEAFSAHQFATAARQGEAAIAAGNAGYDAYLLLGRTYRELSRPSEAASAFAQAAQLRPTLEALTLEGQARSEAHQFSEAQVAFTRARQLDSRDPELSYQLGLVCLELGQFAQAEGDLHDALKLRPHHSPTLVALGRVAAARHQWQDAQTFLQRAITTDERNATAHLELGRILLAQKRLTESVRELEVAARLAPNAADVQTALGVCYHAVGRRAKARDALRRAVALDPNDREARQLLKQI